MPHTRRTLKLDPQAWDLMLDTDWTKPRSSAKVKTAFVAGDGLSISASALGENGATLTYSGLPLHVVYEKQDDEHQNGPTEEFGTFTVSWIRSALLSYTVAISWTSHGGALLDGDQTASISVNGSPAVTRTFRLRAGRQERIGVSTKDVNAEDATDDSAVLSVSINAIPLLDKPVGRIVVADGAYATAQAVANECRVFEGDLAFERGRGLPYYLIALGKKPSPSVLKARLREAALRVEDVKEVTSVDIESLDTETRRLSGEIKVTSMEGENAEIGI